MATSVHAHRADHRRHRRPRSVRRRGVQGRRLACRRHLHHRGRPGAAARRRRGRVRRSVRSRRRRPRRARWRRATSSSRCRAVANLVGGYADGQPVADTPIDDFVAMFELNLRPTYLVTQCALPRLVAAGGGAIVCVSSKAAFEPWAGGSAYAASKAAVAAFARAVAKEHADERRALQRDRAHDDRHPGQPGREPEREDDPAGADRRRHPLPVQRRVGGVERGRAAASSPRRSGSPCRPARACRARWRSR